MTPEREREIRSEHNEPADGWCDACDLLAEVDRLRAEVKRLTRERERMSRTIDLLADERDAMRRERDEARASVAALALVLHDARAEGSRCPLRGSR